MKTLLVCLTVVLFSSFTHAQQADRPQARSFRLISSDQVYDDLYYERRGDPVRLFATPAAVSRPVPAPEGAKLTLFRLTPPPTTAPAGTPPTRTVVAEIAYPADLAEGLVILAGAKENAPLPVVGIALPGLSKTHVPGTARLINLSSFQSALGLNNDVTNAAPRNTESVKSFLPGVTQVNLAVQAPNGGWAPVSSAERNLLEGIRIYALLMDASPQAEAGPPVRAVMIYEYQRPVPTSQAHVRL